MSYGPCLRVRKLYQHPFLRFIISNNFVVYNILFFVFNWIFCVFHSNLNQILLRHLAGEGNTHAHTYRVL